MATRERMIVESVVAALKAAAIPGVPASRVYEERGFALEPQDLPAVDVMSGDSVAEEQGLRSPVTLHTFRFSVEVLVDSTATDAASKVADPIVAAVHRTILASSSVRALIRWITFEATRVERQPSGAGVLCRKSLVFAVSYTASTADLEVAA